MEQPIICRACLTEITLQYISLDTTLYDSTVLDVFNYCTKLEASLDDGFPTNMCIPCSTSLQTAYDFIKTSYETDQLLRGNINGEPEKKEKHKDDGEVVFQDIKKIECDSEKEYLEEYIEDNENIIEIKEEIFKLEVPSPKEENAIELIDEDPQTSFQGNFKSIIKSEVPDENTESQDMLIINEADNDCSRSEDSYMHDESSEEIEPPHSKKTKMTGTGKTKKTSLLDFRYRMRMQRHKLRDANNPFDMSEQQFRERYRFSRDAAQILLEELRPFMKKSQRKTFIPIHLRMCAALEFYANGSFKKDISEDLSEAISGPMIPRIVGEVSEILQNHFANKWITFPSEEEYDAIKKKFFEATGFPGVIGAVDCTKVKIQVPNKEVRSRYFLRKGYYCQNVQLICDFNLQILGVNAHFGGASKDAFIWEGSTVKALLEQRYKSCGPANHNSWLLGDCGYPLCPWLITPYRTSTGLDEQTFNTVHAQARNRVERLSVVLKSVFRCLTRGLFYSPEASERIINACCVLHNFRIKHGILDDIDDVPIDDSSNSDDKKKFFHPKTNTMEECVAFRIRERLKANIVKLKL